MASEQFPKMLHESDVEYGLRHKFLVTHEDKFGENSNRLLCLASCFINVEMYGCTYPNPVMIELKDLISEISDEVEEFRDKIRERKEVQFVKASDAEQMDTQSGGKAYGNFVKSGDSSVQPSVPDDTQAKPTSTGLMAGFVKSGDSSVKSSVPDDTQAKPASSGLMAGFVKSGDSSVTSSSSSDQTLSKPGLGLMSGFVKSGDSPSSSATHSAVTSTIQKQAPAYASPEIKALQDKFYSLSAQLRQVRAKNSSTNSISVLHMATDKVQMAVATTFDSIEDGFVCNLQIDFVDVAMSSPSKQKKQSKNDAYDKALTSLSKPYLMVKSMGASKKELHASDFPLDDGSGSSQVTRLGAATRSDIKPVAGTHRGTQPPQRGFKRRNNDTIYNNFYLMQPRRSTNHAASGILHQSGDFSHKPLKWDFQNVAEGTLCTVTLQGTVIGEDVGDSRQTAKKAASEVALDHLRQSCWTFLIKQSADTDESGISRTEILGDEEKKSDQLPSSNIGSKMMKLMGWSGGGIGKKGQGIKEPINVNTVINREGLGMMAEKGINKNFLPQIKATIQNYARSDKDGDLQFSSEMTKEERALIHSECKKLNLKSHSHGTGDNRFLVVSRKRSPDQLFTMLQRSGGESNKYLLIAPGQELPLEESVYRMDMANC